MDIDAAISELTIVARRLRAAKLIDSTAVEVLDAARFGLELSKASGGREFWHFDVLREQPLEFVPTRSMKYDLKIDLYGQFSEAADGVPLGEHSITVRAWAMKKTCWFSPAMDAAQLAPIIENGLRRRVMLRFRFDYAPPERMEPWFHLQVGGKQTADEYFRLPSNFGVPRFTYHPMNLIMACEFIVRHFYPEDYESVSSEPTWKRALRIAQRAYLARFFRKVDTYGRDCDVSFLEHCWTA